MRVGIAEDSGFFRDALAASIESAGFEVVVKASNGGELVDAVRGDTPDAVILDICLPPTKTDDGLVAAELFRRECPKTGILVLSAYLAAPHLARLPTNSRSHVGCLAKDQLH